jgi:hypothetical protein
MAKSKRKVYHVTPAPAGGWSVKAEDNKNPSGHFKTKNEAVARGKELAKKPALGQVIVHKQDGKIQTKYTYGDDPKKTKG